MTTSETGRTTARRSLEQAQDSFAYEGARSWVLSRRTRIGDQLDVHELARHLDVDSSHVERALTRLSHEQFVDREDFGFSLRPVSIDRAMGMFNARAAIQIGVVEAHLHQLSDALLDRLRGHAVELATIVRQPLPGFERFLAVSHAYNAELISLADSTDLVRAYERMAITELWRHGLVDTDWWDIFDIEHHQVLTEHLRRQDGAAAKAQILRHREQVKTIVATIFESRGGVL
ncbi:MAG: hypothetical protein ACTH31_00205 [Pseudoclavibacter sp.]